MDNVSHAATNPATLADAAKTADMSHNYHPQCGCASCDRADDADEARDEYIEEFAPVEAAKLVGAEDFAWTALGDLSRDVLASLAEDMGRFFTAYHAATTSADEAQAGYPLYRTLKPYIEAAALEQARDEVAEDYDRDLAA